MEHLLLLKEMYLAEQFKQEVSKYKMVKFEYSNFKLKTSNKNGFKQFSRLYECHCFKMGLHNQKIKLDCAQNNGSHIFKLN